MTKYISFSPKAAAGRLRAAIKAKTRDRLRREENTIWAQLINEQIALDRDRAIRARRPAKRGKAAKPEPSAEERLQEYGRELDRLTADFIKLLQHRPTRGRRKYLCWMENVAMAWEAGIPLELVNGNKLLGALLKHVLRAFVEKHGAGSIRELAPPAFVQLSELLVDFDRVSIAANRKAIAAAREVIKHLRPSERRLFIKTLKVISETEGETPLQRVRRLRRQGTTIRTAEEWQAALNVKDKAPAD